MRYSLVALGYGLKNIDREKAKALTSTNVNIAYVKIYCKS